MTSKEVGILSLQGDFDAHARQVSALGHLPCRVVNAAQLKRLEALIIPGGESSVFLKLLSEELKNGIIKRVEDGLPVLATCAGTILLAKQVTNPEQPSLGLIDVDVQRNGYGRQVDSFISDELTLSAPGEKILPSEKKHREGVFIRAPRITRVGKEVVTVFELNGEPVGVTSGNTLALTFHPELSPGFLSPYRFIGL